MSIFLENYMIIIWAIFIFALKTFLDLLVLRYGLFSKLARDKIKASGQELFWIGTMAWGGILIQNDNVQLTKQFGSSPHVRIFILISLIMACIVITALKRIEEGISANSVEGIRSKRDTLLVCFLVIIMLTIGLSNFSMVFSLAAASQR